MPTDDGGSHTFSSTIAPIQVSAGTTVTIATGCVILADVADSALDHLGIWTGDVAHHSIISQDSTLYINAGTITGGLGTDIDGSAGIGLISLNDVVTITGGTITSGIDWLNGPPAATITFPYGLAISGGTFTGSDSIGNSGGTALIVALKSAVNGTISGGTFTGGSPGGKALGVALNDSSQLTISGGAFSGDIDVSITGTATLRFTGTGLTYSGGVIAGTLTSGAAISATIVNKNAGAFTVGGTSTSRTLKA